MISPHLLKVMISYSSSVTLDISNEKGARRKIRELWGDVERPILVLPTSNKDPKWCHIVWAKGPALDDDSEFSNLIIVWWSEMGPDTDRVLSTVDWEKHAKTVTMEDIFCPTNKKKK